MREAMNIAKSKASQTIRILLAIVLVMTMSPAVPASAAESSGSATPMKSDGTLFTSADIHSEEVVLSGVMEDAQRAAAAQASITQQTVQLSMAAPEAETAEASETAQTAQASQVSQIVVVLDRFG